jgi:hypothetical protein
MVQLSATRRSCIAILLVSPVSFAAITLCVAPQRVFIVVLCFVIDSVRKLLDTLSYIVIGLNSELKNTWSYTSTPPYVFMAWYLVKNRDNFTLPYRATVIPALYVPIIRFFKDINVDG